MICALFISISVAHAFLAPSIRFCNFIRLAIPSFPSDSSSLISFSIFWTEFFQVNKKALFFACAIYSSETCMMLSGIPNACIKSTRTSKSSTSSKRCFFQSIFQSIFL